MRPCWRAAYLLLLFRIPQHGALTVVQPKSPLALPTLNSSISSGVDRSMSTPPAEWVDPLSEFPPPFPWTWVKTEEVCQGASSNRNCKTDASPYSWDLRQCKATCAPFYQGAWCSALGPACAYPYWELVRRHAQAGGADRSLPPPLNANAVGGELDACIGKMVTEKGGGLQFVFVADSIGRQLKLQLNRWLQCGVRTPNWLEITNEPLHAPGVAYNQILPWLRDAASPNKCHDFYRPQTTPGKHGQPTVKPIPQLRATDPTVSVVNVHTGLFANVSNRPGSVTPHWAEMALRQLRAHLSPTADTLVVSVGPFGLWDKLFSAEADVEGVFEARLQNFTCAIRCELKAERSFLSNHPKLSSSSEAGGNEKISVRKRIVHVVMSSLFAHYELKPGFPALRLDMTFYDGALWRAFRDVFLHGLTPRACTACSLKASPHIYLKPAWVGGAAIHAVRGAKEMPFSTIDGLHGACQVHPESPRNCEPKCCEEQVKDEKHRRPDDIIWATEQLALGKVCGLISPW